MRNNYILLILQAMLIGLLFFSEGYVKYGTIGLFLLLDLILFIDLLTKKWSSEEVMTLAAIFSSGLFLMFYLFMKSTITIAFGIAVMLLFLVIAMLNSISRTADKSRFDLKKPLAPEMFDTQIYHQDMPYDSYNDITMPMHMPEIVRKPESVMHVRSDHKTSPVNSKLVAKAVAHELEREASELKHAQKLMQEMEIYNAEKELLKETKELEDAQKKIDSIRTTKRAVTAAKELKREAKEMMKVQQQLQEIKAIQELEKSAKEIKKVRKEVKEISKMESVVKQAKNLEQIQKNIDSAKKESKLLQELSQQGKELKKAQKKLDTIKSSKKIDDIKTQALALKNAEKQIKQIKFLDQQEKIVNQAKAIAKAQKDIDALKTKKIEPVKPPVNVKTVKVVDELLYFATDTGDKFHEPGCLSLKKVPKNKLTLYTSRKDAMKKGLKPCNVCIPK